MWAIQEIIDSADKAISPHNYMFKNYRNATKFNAKLLKKHKYDFTKALTKEKGFIMKLGSEFRLVTHIEPLMKDHEYWLAMRKIITKAVPYNL